uniref:Uncharacterized protein n=1 Tax=Arundo donax TaxID=35708 RepID=A0A0A8YCN0_ARUDO
MWTSCRSSRGRERATATCGRASSRTTTRRSQNGLETR